MTSLAPPVPADLPRTLGALRASGYVPRTVKEEIRANLVARLAAGEPTFPGIVGFDDTSIAANIWPALTTVHQPTALAGRALVDLLFETIADGSRRTVLLPTELMVRDSTG